MSELEIIVPDIGVKAFGWRVQLTRSVDFYEKKPSEERTISTVKHMFSQYSKTLQRTAHCLLLCLRQPNRKSTQPSEELYIRCHSETKIGERASYLKDASTMRLNGVATSISPCCTRNNHTFSCGCPSQCES